jgi:hypothetical protein
VVTPTGNKFPAGTPLRAIDTREQLSIAVAKPKASSLMNAPQEDEPGPVATVTGGGTLVKAGGVSSTTVTVCVAAAVFPVASTAVYVMTVLPMGNKLPAGTPLRVAVVLEQLSMALAVPRTASAMTVPHWLACVPVVKVNAAGTLTNCGAMVSVTVIVCVAFETLPAASAAV